MTINYELTHDITAEFVELYQHDRSCDCPACCGDPDDWNDHMPEDDPYTDLDEGG